MSIECNLIVGHYSILRGRDLQTVERFQRFNINLYTISNMCVYLAFILTVDSVACILDTIKRITHQ